MSPNSEPPQRGEVLRRSLDPLVGGEQRKAMADQLTTISKLRLRERIGSLARADIAAVERAICVQLAL